MSIQEITKKQKNFSADGISFSLTACDCEIETRHPAKGVTKNVIQIYPSNESKHYTYKNGKELVDISVNGEEIAVLPGFLAIKDNAGIKKFIERHGYLFPFEPDKDNSLETDVLFSFIHRMDAVVNLMAILGDEEIDYKKILAFTLYLLLTPQTQIEFSDGRDPYGTCNHKMTYVWNSLYDFDKLVARQEEGDVEERWGIEDSVRPLSTVLHNYEYYSVAYEEFRDVSKVGDQCRLAIDFLLHFTNDVSDILEWDYKGNIKFINSLSDAEFKEKFNTQLENALMALAKQTLKSEIDWHIGHAVIPSYDYETLTPGWIVTDLISGMYFSLFNVRVKEESYRICTKPNCGHYFLVKRDAVKKKYCRHNCSNAMAQRKHQRKKAEGQSKET